MNLIYLVKFMRLRALTIFGCLLLFCSACGLNDSDDPGSEFALIDHSDTGNLGTPDAGELDIETHDDTDGYGTDGNDADPIDLDGGDTDGDDRDGHQTDSDTTPDATPAEGPYGTPCSDDSNCRLGSCIQGSGFTDGYCSSPDACESDDDCPEDGVCHQNSEVAYCGLGCDGDGDCREGYTCQTGRESELKACAPALFDEPEDAGLDGAACLDNSHCDNDYCLEDPEWPGGYCTTVECSTFEDCARGGDESAVNNRCLVQQGSTNFCVRMCQSAQDCRDDYICEAIGGDQGFCSPNPSADINLDNLADYPFEIVCGLESVDGRINIDYEVAADTTSYMVTPFAMDSKDLTPLQTTLPDQTEISYFGPNRFQAVPAQLFGFINPILNPPLERFSEQLQSGAHQLELSTRSENMCYYLLEEQTPGDTIDLNIYLVGLEMSAEQAQTDPDLQAVLDQFGNVYAQAGVSVGEVHFHEITGDDAEAYQIIRTDFDIQQLVALSTLPDGGYDGAVSANIFFVRDIQLGGGAIGISQGLPGAAGLHGTPASGVVFTSAYLGEHFQGEGREIVDGNDFTGIVMAHEVGHYLGLFHTSEQYGQGFDPIQDTPACTDSSDFPSDCPDIDNLMFPLAGISHTELTAGQIYTLQANPLTKD